MTLMALLQYLELAFVKSASSQFVVAVFADLPCAVGQSATHTHSHTQADYHALMADVQEIVAHAPELPAARSTMHICELTERRWHGINNIMPTT